MYQTFRWSENSGPPPEGLKDLGFKASPLPLGKQSLHFYSQKFEGIEVEDSFYKEVSSSKPEFISYHWAMNPPDNLQTNVRLMNRDKSRILEKFFKRTGQFQQKNLLYQPELIIQNGELHWKLIFKSGQDQVLGVYLNRFGQIKKIRVLSSGFGSAAATLFPDGPTLSQLQKVWLTDLIDSQVLVSRNAKVTTQSDQTAIAQNSQFLYPVGDRRFDQVQAFFYMTKLLAWVEKNFSFALPFILEAETSVGFPEKTNTAFYYQHRIRLGDGDDAVFSHIPMDPSIVFHESFHAIVEAIAKLPYEGEGGSLNEAFADYFTCLMTGSPNLGEASYKKGPFKRTIQNSLSFKEKNGGLYHDSGIVSGLLWSLQEVLGAATVQNLAFQVLLRLTPNSNFESFKIELKELLAKLPAEQQVLAQSVLQKRGWAE